MNKYEEKYTNDGFSHIAGVDEAGRGPIAGPVVSAAVILDPSYTYEYINDSKKLTEKQRLLAYNDIKKHAVVSVSLIDAKVIDEINILEATKLSMLNSIKGLRLKPSVVLIDAVELKSNYKTVSIIKGDQKSISIAAASIVAKVTRDNIMKDYSLIYPEYNFHKNKGYPTKEHKLLVEKYGACDIHRRSFAPIKYLK